MSLEDVKARFRARVAPNQPQLALADNTVLMAIAQALLAEAEDVRDAVTAVQPQLFISQSSGATLAARAADFGVTISQGTPATGTVTFTAPAAPSSPITIPAGTVVTTAGDGITTIAQTFSTQATVTITNPATSVSVAIAALPDANGQYHASANVAANTITVLSTPISGLSVTNAAVTAGGTDPDSDAQIRANTYKVLQPKYGTAAIESAALAVSGVYDAYCSDPANGSGTIKLYWADVNGNTPGLSGDTSTGGTITAGTLAATVQTQVAAVLPPNTVCNFAPFTIDNLTAVAVSVSAPAAVQTATLTPQVQAAVAAYVQGNGTARSGLSHNMVPNGYAMGATVQTSLNPQSGAITGLAPVVGLTYFALGATTPAIGSAANTTLYRLTGTPSTVVTVTRV